MNAPVAVMTTAGEGGPWGMAILASYMVNKQEDESFSDFLNKRVFAGEQGVTVSPEPEDVEGFDKYIENYKKAIEAQKAAIMALPL